MATDAAKPLEVKEGPVCEKCGRRDGKILAIQAGDFGGYVSYMHKRCYNRGLYQILTIVAVFIVSLLVWHSC